MLAKCFLPTALSAGSTHKRDRREPVSGSLYSNSSNPEGLPILTQKTIQFFYKEILCNCVRTLQYFLEKVFCCPWKHEKTALKSNYFLSTELLILPKIENWAEAPSVISTLWVYSRKYDKMSYVWVRKPIIINNMADNKK